MDIKIKRNICRDTKVSVENIKESLLVTLHDQEYKVIENDGMVIYFDNSKDSLFVSRIKAFSEIDDGKFEILITGRTQALKLTYNTSVLTEAIIVTLMIFGGIISNIFYFIFAALIMLQLLIRFVIIRNTAKNLILSIIRERI